jgi:hypothetical protein
MSRRKRLTFWGADENDDSLPCSVMVARLSRPTRLLTTTNHTANTATAATSQATSLKSMT